MAAVLHWVRQSSAWPLRCAVGWEHGHSSVLHAVEAGRRVQLEAIIRRLEVLVSSLRLVHWHWLWHRMHHQWLVVDLLLVVEYELLLLLSEVRVLGLHSQFMAGTEQRLRAQLGGLFARLRARLVLPLLVNVFGC